jgi:hypothetical protein
MCGVYTNVSDHTLQQPITAIQEVEFGFESAYGLSARLGDLICPGRVSKKNRASRGPARWKEWITIATQVNGG